MKVADNNSTPVQLDAYIRQFRQQNRHADALRPDGGPVAGPNDKVQLSDEARAILQASRAGGAHSDIREDKVQQVKMAVEKGTYRVDGSQVAADMLEESFENNALLQQINMHV